MPELKLNLGNSLSLTPQAAAAPAQVVKRSTRTQRKAGEGLKNAKAQGAQNDTDAWAALEKVEAQYCEQVQYYNTVFRQLDDPATERYRLSHNTAHWFALVFQTRENKDLFLEAVQWQPYGDKYLCGEQMATLMGHTMPLPKGVLIQPMSLATGSSLSLAQQTTPLLVTSSVNLNSPLEDTSKQEVDPDIAGANQMMAEHINREQTGRALSGDSEFWVALSFQSSERKAQFLRLTGWTSDFDTRYLCGELIANRMGLELTFDIPVFAKEDKLKMRLMALALPYQEGING